MTVHRLRPRQRAVAHGGEADGVPFAVTRICPEGRRAAGRVLASGWVTTGPETEKNQEGNHAPAPAPHGAPVVQL